MILTHFSVMLPTVFLLFKLLLSIKNVLDGNIQWCLSGAIQQFTMRQSTFDMKASIHCYVSVVCLVICHCPGIACRNSKCHVKISYYLLNFRIQSSF